MTVKDSAEQYEGFKMPPGIIATERFKCSTGAFLTRLFYLYSLTPVLILISLIAVAIVMAATFNVMFVVVALMIMFILAPAIMAWLYISKGMLPESAFNITWHSLEIEEYDLLITTCKPHYKVTGEEESETEVIDRWETVRKLQIRYDNMTMPMTGGDGVTIKLKDKDGFIAVPIKAFHDKESYLEFVNTLADKIKSTQHHDTQGQ